MEITYTKENGRGITLKSVKPFFLQRVNGTGDVRQAINTFHAPDQDGAFYISGTMDMRNITLEGTVVASNAEQTAELRRHLLQAFTPKEKGMLTCHSLQIPCVVEEAGFVAGQNARAPSFFISLLCPSPFFEALNEIRVDLAVWLRRFSFPVEIPEATGIELGGRQPSRIIAVDNFGDVPCGCTIVFTALGTLVNPELLNVDTGEVMRILKIMTAGETVRVDTRFAGKKVTSTVGGETTNAFKYIDPASTFLQLSPGRNTLRYNAGENLDLLEVSIYYRPQYLGV